MAQVIHPSRLSWDEVDPRRVPFDVGSALTVINALEPSGHVPLRPPGPPFEGTVIRWSRREGKAWTRAMTQALIDHYGSWAAGWRWVTDGELGGGPVHGWCCPRDSMTTPAETLEGVRDALCEWREWLEELAEQFDRHPLDSDSAEERGHLWGRVATHLVNIVVIRTRAGDTWYGHCKQVLTWYLIRWGVDSDTAREQVQDAVGGNFRSWIAPTDHVVDGVAERLGASLRARS
jgi:hypothetical protein